VLRSLLSERFHLKQHGESRQMRVYELTVAPGGPKIQPAQPGSAMTGASGFHFRGDMRYFAGLSPCNSRFLQQSARTCL
jgi:uncharacterized protein (TIGR03435 family)